MNLAGFTQKLQQLLNTLDVDVSEEPVWSIRQAKTRIYLDIAWSRIPAKNVCHDNLTTRVSTGARNDSDSVPAPAVAPKVVKISTCENKTKKKKRKSPATRRRDRKRLAAWKAKREVVSAPLPKSMPVSSTKIAVSGDDTIQNCQQDKAVKPIPAPRKRKPVNVPCATATEPAPVVYAPEENFIIQEILTQREELDTSLDLENICFNTTCLVPESQVPGGLKKCTRCNFAKYCGRICQAEHWKVHRSACGKI